ncbi:MAG: DUF4418 family protein [Anaerolineae bacterium]
MKVAAGVIVILAVAIAIIPMFTDCQSAGRTLTLESGRQIPMKCHWSGRAELGLGLPLAAVGLMVGFSQSKEARRILGVAGTTLGAAVILIPTELIGVCMNPDMPCVSTMKPALILGGALAMGVSVGIIVASWGKEEDLA